MNTFHFSINEFFFLLDSILSLSNYTCSVDDAAVDFTPISSPLISHSASDVSSNCSLSQCINSANNSCLSSQTPCFHYVTKNNINYCAPASFCSILQPYVHQQVSSLRKFAGFSYERVYFLYRNFMSNFVEIDDDIWKKCHRSCHR